MLETPFGLWWEAQSSDEDRKRPLLGIDWSWLLVSVLLAAFWTGVILAVASAL